MNFPRKLELISGVTTCLLGFALAGYLLFSDFRTAQRLDLDSSTILLALLAAFLFFIIPALLIGMGVFFQVVRERSAGQAMVVIGSLILMITFAAVFFKTGYEPVGVIQARFVLAILAFVTLIISFYRPRGKV